MSHQFHLGTHREMLINAANVGFGGFRADMQEPGDIIPLFSVEQIKQHGPLPGSKLQTTLTFMFRKDSPMQPIDIGHHNVTDAALEISKGFPTHMAKKSDRTATEVI